VVATPNLAAYEQRYQQEVRGAATGEGAA
jgi:hypothetical protein